MTYQSPGVYTKESDFSYYVRHISTSIAGFVGVTERGPINKPQLVTSWQQYLKKFGGHQPNSHLSYAAWSFFFNGGSQLYVTRVAHYTNVTDRSSLTAQTSSMTLRDLGGATATLATGTTGTDRITWTATTPGIAGNLFEIEAVANGINTILDLDFLGNRLTIQLATDAEGNPTTTVTQLDERLAEETAPWVSLASTETGTVAPFSPQTLSGGTQAAETLAIKAASPGEWADQLHIEVAHQDDGLFSIRVIENGELEESWTDLTMDESSPRHAEKVVNPRSNFIQIEDLRTDSGTPTDRPEQGLYQLSGGHDGLDGLNDSDFIGDPATRTGMHAFAQTKLNMMAVPGISSPSVIHNGIAIAEQRRNLIFLIDPPVYLEPQEVADFAKGRNHYSHSPFVSSYAAIYYPWTVVPDPRTKDERLVPPSGAVAGRFAQNDKDGAVWTAPAGNKRGRISGSIMTNYELSQGEVDSLYAEGINPILDDDISGIRIWGQRTLAGLWSAVDRLNVRRLLIYLRESIAQATQFVVFEPNDPLTWNAIKRVLNPFLAHIQKERGIAEFRVQCDEETNPPALIDNHQVGVRVFVTPIKAAEIIEIDFALTATGANFNELYNNGNS